MKITIGAPYIMCTGGGYSLCSDIEGINNSFTLWYEVDEEYKQYLCTERADAFLIGLLPYAMAHSSTSDPLVVVCEAPVSEQLFYQLNVHYIPTLVRCIDWYHNIIIKCNLNHTKLDSLNAVGTGVSGGVDSWYTLLKSKQENSPRYQITHGAYFEFDPEGIFDDELQNEMRKMAKNICVEYGITFINIKSNICKDVYHVAHEAIITCMLLSYIIVLQKMFSIFYISSSYPYRNFKILDYSSEHYELLNVHCLSNENLSFYTPGSEVTRYEKTEYIADYDLPKRYLMVCRDPKVENGILKNCSRCSKCTRTMIQLDLAGKLDYFYDVFNVKAYRDDTDYYLGYLIFKGNKDDFVADTLDKFKQLRKPFPFSARIAGFKKWVKNGFKRGNPLQYNYRP
jgi:hypothetical protein